MTVKLLGNQCEPLHAMYGAQQCCLCAARKETARLRDLLHEADRMLAEALPKLQEAERYLRAAREEA